MGSLTGPRSPPSRQTRGFKKRSGSLSCARLSLSIFDFSRFTVNFGQGLIFAPPARPTDPLAAKRLEKKETAAQDEAGPAQEPLSAQTDRT